jgi:two-component system cell cycle response regulator
MAFHSRCVFAFLKQCLWFMNASVLIVGAQAFCNRLMQMVRALPTHTVRYATSVTAATTALAESPAELVIVQAGNPTLAPLCTHLRQQRHWRWLYCLLVDDRDLASGAPQDWLLHCAQQTTQALEQGADGYLRLPDALPVAPALAPNSTRAASPDQDKAETAWVQALQAHLHKAYERLQTYQEMSKANDWLSSIALLDALTQIGNRRAFDIELARQIEIAQQRGEPLGLILLDIDHFKAVNDNYGHLVGDEVLRIFAERLRHHLRFHETPFRYGGEEFVVVLPATDLPQTQQVAERLRQIMGNHPFIVNDQVDLSLTVSLGVAVLADSDDAKGQQLLARADHRLLKAKRNGRNQVMVR